MRSELFEKRRLVKNAKVPALKRRAPASVSPDTSKSNLTTRPHGQGVRLTICDSFNEPGYEQSSCSHYISRNSCCSAEAFDFLLYPLLTEAWRECRPPTPRHHHLVPPLHTSTPVTHKQSGAALWAAGYGEAAAGCNFIQAG